jgi:L-alanine-DL-glutamate epimerase-like enolase superfamily enzyme
MNPLDIKVINEKLYRSTFCYGRRGVVLHAIGGIDIALWDIAGKYYNQPIYQLLGGAFHKKIRAYASSVFGKNGEETCKIAEDWVSKGFTAIKFGWHPLGESEEMDLELVSGARRGAGEKVDLMIDAGCCYDTMTAIKRVNQFEDYNISWLEEPLEQDNLEGYRKLTNVSRIPIAAGEGETGRFAWKDLIEKGGINIAQIEIARNGITEGARIADMAEDHGLRVINHFYSTGINLAAGLHWLSSRRSAFIFEYSMSPSPLRKELTTPIIGIDEEGFIHVHDGPGLGIELNDDMIEKYSLKKEDT